jgi:hypothetical protein
MNYTNIPLDLQELIRSLNTTTQTKARLMEIDTGLLNLDHPAETITICTACYEVINQTWHHREWCELYEEEALSKWLKNGKKNACNSKNNPV